MGKIKILSINSLLYSGSTILTINLNKYDKVASVGELAKVYNNVMAVNENEFFDEDNVRLKCSCGKMFNNCEFWISVLEEFKLENVSFNSDFTRYYTNKNSKINKVKDKLVEKLSLINIRNLPNYLNSHHSDNISNYKLMNIILKLQGGEIFLDAQKFWRISFYQLNSKLFDFTGIHLLRNGLAQIESFLKHKKHKDLDYTEAVQIWKKSIENILRLYKNIEDKSILVKYEDYCLNSNETEKKILNFAGINNQIKNHSKQFHLLGNYKTRLFNNDQIVLNEEWKNSITKKKLEIFKRISGDLHEKLGYSNEI